MGARPSSFKAEKETVAKAVSVTPWTKQQKAIFQWFRKGKGNLTVRARAGTGKTTTILEAINYAAEEFICLCAFNTKIADRLAELLGNPNAIAKTLHSLGFDAIKTRWRHARYSKDRKKWLTDQVCEAEITSSARWVITELHTYARENHPYCKDASEMLEIALHHGFGHDDYPLVVLADRAYDAMELATTTVETGVDFADMIYLPLRCKLIKPRFNLIVVDEAQDMSAPQLEIAQGLLEPGGRMVIVGDDRQAMYAFRGADSQSLDRLAVELNAEELPLTTSFRCDQEIIALAQKFVPDIQARPKAGQGHVDHRVLADLFDQVAPGDFVLSRTNAPLMSVAMRLLRSEKRCKIEGRKIGDELDLLVRKLSKWGKISSVDFWLDELHRWAEKETARAMRAEEPQVAERIQDQALTLRIVSENAENVEAIRDRIAYLFEDDPDREEFIVCSTVHKAKGLEATNVFALAWTFNIPVGCENCTHRHVNKRCSCGCSEYVPDPAAVREEQNICYVAITRAKERLVWITQGA